MKLPTQQLEHLAELARLELTDVEKVKFGSQLSSILEYVNVLSRVDTTGVEPTLQVTGLENVARQDRVLGCEADIRELIVKNIPQREGDLLKVQGVFQQVTPYEE